MSSSQDTMILFGPERKPWVDTVSNLTKSSEDGKLLVTPPSTDPLDQYKQVYSKGRVTGPMYQVTSLGFSKLQQDAAHKETLDLMHQQQSNFLGYQSCMDMSQNTAPVLPYLAFNSNA